MISVDELKKAHALIVASLKDAQAAGHFAAAGAAFAALATIEAVITEKSTTVPVDGPDGSTTGAAE